MTGTAVTKRANLTPEQRVAHVLDSDGARRFLTKFLPNGVSYELFVATVQLAVAKNGSIASCSPESIVTAVGQALKSGLEIGDTAHLVPYGRTLTFIADYKGIAQLIVASGAVRHVELRAVYEGDDFDYAYGLEQRLEHVPCAVADRKKLKEGGYQLKGAYVVFRLPFNAPPAFEYMPVEDIDAIRQAKSQAWKAGPVLPWYAKKTVLRQAAKTLSKDKRAAAAMRAIEADIEAELGAIPEDEDDEIPRASEPTEPSPEKQGDDGFQDDRDLPE